jgi:hypothetical protein
MAYQINKTDGTIISTVADGQVDTLSTDLTLIGKNYSGFGEALNENFIKLLENFSSTQAPTYPLRGQVWFDTAENKLKVYNGSDFIPVSSATISSSQPETLSIGDLWWNDVAAQLYFFDGTNPVLLAPAYSQAQGVSGLRVDSILDTLNQTRVITSLYNNGILLGIFAKDSFTPKIEIIGFSGSIGPGFNAGTLSDIKFRGVTCTNSEQLGGAPATTYARRDTSNTLNGQLRVSEDQGVVIGAGNQLTLYVESGDVEIANRASNKDLFVRVTKSDPTDPETAVAVDSSERIVSIYPGKTDSTVNVGGSLVVTGDLTVEGITTTINTANLTVEDKNIVIANVASPTNSSADGAGITIKGTTDKTIVYSNANNWLDISEDINLSNSLKSYLIGNTPVIQPILPFTGSYRLGSAVTEISGVVTIGAQKALDIGPSGPAPAAPAANVEMRLKDNRISTVKDNLNLELAPDGTGNVVLIGSPKITGMADPTDPQDAATKEYVDSTIQSRSIGFSMDLTDGKSNSYIITEVLNILHPPAEYRNGTLARILCTLVSASSTNLNINALPPATSTAAFITDHLTGASANALTNISFPLATIAAASISTSRIIKLFTLSAGAWVWTSDTPLPP